MKTFDIGDVVQNEEYSFSIDVVNDFDNAYNIREITSFCSCLKVEDYTKEGVYPLGKECIHNNIFSFKFKLKKKSIGENSTKAEIIFESPFADEIFKYIVIKYNVIKKDDNE
jgi:hypothetical protein